MPTVVTLGEAMVVFTSEEYIPLEYATSFKKGWGGAEANFAVGVRRLGVDVGWISRIGKDPFGNFIIKNLKSEGVDVSGVKIDEDHPTGIYFKEKRNSIIANVVLL
ncbi:MAG: 2-dehydro-3-deoxygluconokinase [Clostridia bacterium]|nr:2-dehydro-3-deoxygluconokinase [Clostridia bacterium]